MALRFVLLGPPGSGKSTQGTRISAKFGVPLLGSGDLIRRHIARGTEFGKKVEAQIAAGNFAPDADILYWMKRRLEEPDAAAGWVLDGFPRDVSQAWSFDQELGVMAHEMRAIEIRLRSRRAEARLIGRRICGECGRTLKPGDIGDDGLCGCGGALTRRPDDEGEAVRRRMAIYRSITAPVVDYYAQDSRLASIDGDGTEDEVFERLLRAMDVDRS